MAKNKRRAKHSFHKRFLLHPLTVFLILSMGVVLLGTTFKASAVDIAVVAKVPAPLPDGPAVIQIVQPEGSAGTAKSADNSSQNPIAVHTQTVTLTGTCPKATYLQFYRNGTYVGTTPCIGDPTFSIQIDLEYGLNTIIAHVFNITDDEGPISIPIYINYSAAPIASPGQTTIARKNPQFLLTGNFSKLGFLINEPANWNVIIKSGVSPFAFSVDWGDGQTSDFNETEIGPFNISHTYTKASESTGYIIAVRGTDGTGQKAELNLMSIISNPNTRQAEQVQRANAKLSAGFFGHLKKWLWPAYIIVFLMLVSFWLGEREEYSILRRKSRRRRK